MLAVLAVAGLFMTANIPTLAAEHSTVDALSSWTASLPTDGATDMMMSHFALIAGKSPSVEIGRNLSATLVRNIKA